MPVIWHWREACVQLMVFVPVQLKICCGSRKNKVVSASPVLKDICQYGCLADTSTSQGCGDLRAGPALTLLVARGGAGCSGVLGHEGSPRGDSGSVRPMGALRSQPLDGCLK